MNYGGAIYNSFGKEMIIENSTFSGKSTTNYAGGAIYSDTQKPVTVLNSTFYNNTAGSEGGAIYQATQTSGDYLTIINSTISGNSASSATVGAGVASYGALRIYNTILANSVVGYDCSWKYFYGMISIHNLIENNAPGDYSCVTPYLTVNPLLIPLADNGGATETMALDVHSPAIDVGDADHCPPTDQRGDSYPRPQGAGCDLGAYEFDSYPIVLSIKTIDPNPTSASQVRFAVTFNEPITGVDSSDFDLTTTGSILSASVFAVNGSDDVYSIRIQTGTGTGTIRLDVIDDDTIMDSTSNPLGGAGAENGDFDDGEEYIVRYYFFYLPLIIR